MTILRPIAICALAAPLLLSLAGCSEASGEDGHSGHDHDGDHQMAKAEADDTTLEAVMASKAGQTLPYYNSEEFTPVWLPTNSSKLAKFHRIPDFAFVNQNGKTVSSANYDDNIYVATFFFATCPGICSPINNRLLTVQEAIVDYNDVRILSHSITPEIDTVPVLNKYAKENDIDSRTWDLVTGDRDDLYAVAKNGYFASEDLGEAEAKGDFKHTENILLIDRNGMIRGIYNGLSRNAMFDVIADIKLLRQEQPKG